MKRTDLSALADSLELRTAWLDSKMDDPVKQACDILRQIAESQPVAWKHDVVDDDGELDQVLSFSPDNFPLEGIGGFRSVKRVPLFTLPLED